MPFPTRQGSSREPRKDDKTTPDEDRDAIIARRKRFIAGALVGLAGASIVAACGGEDDGQLATDAGADDGAVVDGGTPQPCLSKVVRPDGGPQDGSDGGDEDVAIPQPCLEPPLPDSGGDT